MIGALIVLALLIIVGLCVLIAYARKPKNMADPARVKDEIIAALGMAPGRYSWIVTIAEERAVYHPAPRRVCTICGYHNKEHGHVLPAVKVVLWDLIDDKHVAQTVQGFYHWHYVNGAIAKAEPIARKEMIRLTTESCKAIPQQYL